jgi:zeaxanthin glucosyltransferase
VTARRILFHLLPELGHLQPTFGLARALAARGHDVLYTAPLDLVPRLAARGWRCVPIHRAALPAGALTEIEALETDDEREAAWMRVRAAIEEEYFSGRIEALVREVAPSVIAADVITLSPLQLVAHALGVPCVQLSTSLPQAHDAARPPITSALPPDADPFVQAAARWESSCLRFLAFRRVPIATVVAATTREYAARFGYPRDRISFAAAFTPRLLAAPELVLAAPALDHPGRAARYAPAPVDLAREETVPPALAAFAGGDAPLIYASLGSQSSRYPHALRFFRAVVELARARSAWRVVVVAGPRFAAYPELARVPDNLHVLVTAPQLWLLRRAAVFVTHAGLGSVREAIACGVPMVVVPQLYDQHGNAARVVALGVGARVPAEAVTAATLARAVDAVVAEPAPRAARLAALDERCRAAEAENAGVEIVEAAAVDAPPQAAALAPEPPIGPWAGWMLLGLASYAALRPGARLVDARPAIGVGCGFAAYPDLASALARAGGSVLARVELDGELRREDGAVVGRELRALWLLDLEATLFDHAVWCVERAAGERDAPTSIALAELTGRVHAVRRRGGTVAASIAAFRDAFAAVVPAWGELGGAAAAAAPAAHDAARWASLLACQQRARAAADRGHPYRAAFIEAAHEHERELERRVDACIRAARYA